VALVAQQTGRC